MEENNLSGEVKGETKVDEEARWEEKGLDEPKSLVTDSVEEEKLNTVGLLVIDFIGRSICGNSELES